MTGEAGRKKAAEPPSAEEVTALFRHVEELLQEENFEQALKVCNKLPLDDDSGRCRLFCLLQLGRWPAATDLVKTLKQLKAAEADEAAAARAYLFEEAYCLYRLNRAQKALQLIEENAEVVQSLPQDERLRITHLKAQTLHRLGDYDACRAIYEELLQHDCDNEMLLVNFLSAVVCAESRLGGAGEARGKASLVPPQLWQRVEANLDRTYELPFNAACLAIHEGRLDDAEDLLQRAKALCAEESGVSNPDDEEEAFAFGDLVGILVQSAYLRERQGRADEARELYARLLQHLGDEGHPGRKAPPGDEEAKAPEEELDLSVLAVAHANAFLEAEKQRARAAAGEEASAEGRLLATATTLDDILKRLSRGRGPQALEQKLTRAQALALATYRCVAFIRVGRLEEARRLLAVSGTKFGAKHPKLLLVRAALQLAGGRPAKAEEQLRQVLSAPSLSAAEAVRAHLALAALRIDQGDAAGAARLLVQARARLADFDSEAPPGDAEQADLRLTLLRGIVALQQRAGDAEGAMQSLDAQLQLWRDGSQSGGDSRYVVSVLLTAAASCAALGHWEAAAAKCEEASQQALPDSPEYLHALVGAVDAASHAGGALSGAEAPKDAAKRLAELKQRLPAKVLLLDSDEVEKQDPASAHLGGGPQGARRKARAAGEEPSGPGGGDSGDAVAKAEKKKKRKPRWPKGFDPNEPHLPPDPERWLPKCERTGYKKMLRRRKEAGRGGAQGAVAPGTAEATTGFRNTGPSTAKTEAARDTGRNVGSRKKRGARK